MALVTHQRPSVILRDEGLIDDEVGLFNLILDNWILANAQQQQQTDGSLSSEIERKYRDLGVDGEWPSEIDD